MKVKVMVKHDGYGQFPTFKKGTAVTIKEEDAHFLNWYACEIEGRQTWVPKTFFLGGALTRNYNPTELIQQEGDILEVKEIVYAWLIAADSEGITGWIPAEAVISLMPL